MRDSWLSAVAFSPPCMAKQSRTLCFLQVQLTSVWWEPWEKGQWTGPHSSQCAPLPTDRLGRLHTLRHLSNRCYCHHLSRIPSQYLLVHPQEVKTGFHSKLAWTQPPLQAHLLLKSADVHIVAPHQVQPTLWPQSEIKSDSHQKSMERGSTDNSIEKRIWEAKFPTLTGTLQLKICGRLALQEEVFTCSRMSG